MPTGLTNSQDIRFCFKNLESDPRFFLNGLDLPLTSVNGLAIASITGMMQFSNHIEIRWRGHLAVSNCLTEHFAAWLEISETQLSPPSMA